MTKFWHIATKDEIEDSLNTDFERGMTNEFAQSKVKQSRNKSDKCKKKSLKPFVVHFSSVMAILLVILSVVFMFTGKAVEGTSLVILVLISELSGYGQDAVAYFKEKKAKRLLLPEAMVVRAGEEKVIPADEVVPGDIVILKKGDIVPCDGRIITSSDLEVNEKAVTGNESVKKDSEAELTEETPVSGQTNMLFKGSSISSGDCRIVACVTGEDTVIASMQTGEEITEKSFMQDKISEVGKVLAVLGFVLIAVLFAISWISGVDLWQAGALCLALGAVLVPAKLSSVISYIVNRGMLKIAEDGSIVKGETIAESLALCDVVITGKSGILTKEEAEIKGVFTYEGQWNVGDAELTAQQKSIQEIMLDFAAICTDSSEEKNISEEYAVDSAFLKAAKEMGIKADRIEVSAFYPFDAKRKIMTAVAQTGEEFRVITKGNVKEILDRSKQVVTSTELYDMSEEIKADLLEKCENAAQSGFKTIAVAYKDSSILAERDEAEKDLIFVGVFMLENEIRKESVKAVKELASAGIKTVVATYDIASVAEFIAILAGIKRENCLVLTGEELRKLSESELDEKIENISVFAELKPEDKEKIVSSYKRIGKTVCVIADSSHDMKALELSDISVAKKGGSDVTSQNANVVTDGSFTGFVNTVKKCQSLYLDVRKALRYMISGAISLIVFTIFALLLTGRLPITPLQALAIGVLVSGLMTLGLPAGGAWEKLKLKDVKKKESIFLNMWTRILACGIFSAVVALVLFVVVRFFTETPSDSIALSSAQTCIFVYFVFAGLFNLLALRINAIKMKEGTEEIVTLASVVLICILAVVIVLTVPAMKIVFGFGENMIMISVLTALLPAVFSIVLGAFKLIKKSEKAEESDGTDI